MGKSRLLEELKSYFDVRMDRLEGKIDTRCDKCIYVPTFREQIKTLFNNVYTIWGVIGAAGTGMGALLYFFITNFIGGKK